MSARQTAIVTGAASGIGLALSKHLISRGWRVVLADVNEECGLAAAKELGHDAIFFKIDVTNWDDNLRLFQRTWEWSGRVDFLAINAGIVDTELIYDHYDGEPTKPDMKTLDVNLTAAVYQTKLFLHYARQNKIPGGKIVMTSSAAGLYRFGVMPLYCAAKHGVIGYVRSIASTFALDGITVNAICPAFVASALTPKSALSMMPSEHLTPLSTIVQAYDRVLDDNSMTGQVIEASQNDLFFRKQVEYPNQSEEWLMEDLGGFWANGYSQGKKQERQVKKSSI